MASSDALLAGAVSSGPSSESKQIVLQEIKAIKDKASFIKASSLINLFLRREDLGHGQSDGKLVTTPANAKASEFWELVITSKMEGEVRTMFHNKPAFAGKGFEMIAHLYQEYFPSSRRDVLTNVIKLCTLRPGPKDKARDIGDKVSEACEALEGGGQNARLDGLCNFLNGK